LLEVNLPRRTSRRTQRQVATERSLQVAKLLAMQDNSEESIHEQEEGRDEKRE
jgi:hypothetical protein